VLDGHLLNYFCPHGQQFGYSARNYGNDDSVYDFLEEIDVDHMKSRRINVVASAKIP